MSAMQPHAKEKRAARIAQLDGIVPYLFALGCARAWVTLMFAAPSTPLATAFDPHVLFDYAYCILAVAVAVGARKIIPLSARPWSQALALGGMLAASVCSVAASYVSDISVVPAVLGALAGGLGFSMFLLIWAEALGALSLLRIFLYTTASQLAAVVFVFFCQGFDALRMDIALILLPLAAIASVRYAARKAARCEKTPQAYPRFSYPWKLFILFALYSFAYGLRASQLADGAGMHSSASTAIAMGILFAGVYFFSGRFNVGMVYRSPLLLMVCGFVLVPAESVLGSSVSSYLISMSYSLMTVLVSLLLYDISKRLGIAIVALASIKSAEQIFIVRGKDASALLASSPLSAATQDMLVTVTVAVLILASTFILFSERELSSKWGVTILDSGTLVERSTEEERLEKRCDDLTAHYRLSPREDEILRLIAQGKTSAAIEQELFIAEGTFKAHTRHIYEKIGINSKKELRALLDSE